MQTESRRNVFYFIISFDCSTLELSKSCYEISVDKYASVVLEMYRIIGVVFFQIFLAMSGLLSIGMAIIFTYGVGLGTGIMFGPIHQITPFMLLGMLVFVFIWF